MSPAISKKRSIFVFFVIILFHCPRIAFAQPSVPDKYTAGLPFSMPEVRIPVFPDRKINITDYGAVGDGQTNNTGSINSAIQECAKLGGGTVIIPPGTWLTGPIKLESNINFYSEKGALIQFSGNINDYPFVESLDGSQHKYKRTHLFNAYRVNNIAITGDGIFDGAGEIWRYVLKEDLTESQWKKLIASGGTISPDGKEWWPSEAAMNAENILKISADAKKALLKKDFELTKEYFRPNLINIMRCNGVLLDGPTFENSPRYNVIFQQCENITVRNVKVLSPTFGKNTDGIDLSACRNAVVYNCTIDVGDDGICLKPGAIADMQKAGPACENIIIADCTVYHAHGGFVIGSETYGGARNVSVRNCVFIGTDVGIRFKSLRGRGGLIEKIFIDGIQMRDIVTDAILFDMYYSGGSPDVEARKDLSIRKYETLTDRTPQFRDFNVKNIICTGCDRALVINGLPELSIKNIFLDNVSITSNRGVFIADADGIYLNKCRIIPKSGTIFNLIQSRNILIEDGYYPKISEKFLKVSGERSGNIRLAGLNIEKLEKMIERSKDVREDAVKLE